MDWIKINENGEIEFNSEEVKLVPELQILLTHKYNKAPGDNEGRKKKRALNELKYLYLVYSPKSPYRDYSEKERIEEAKTDCKLPVDWQPSTELLLLIPKFIKGLRNKPSRALATVEKFLEKFEGHLEAIKLDERTATGGLVHNPKNIMQTLQELPSFIQTIRELERQSKLDITAAPGAKGDHEIGWLALNNTTNNGKRNTRESDNAPSEEDQGEVQ